MIEIAACIRSAGEPQLPKCLAFVRMQTVQFVEFHHVEVVPESAALSALLDKVTVPWMMLIDADMTLYPEAVNIVTSYIEEEKNPNVAEYQFGLYDSFLLRPINSCRVSRVDVIRGCKIKDWLGNDLSIVRQIEEKGFNIKRLWKRYHPVVIGNHFENPSDFQIFLRFYHAGVARTKGTEKVLNDLYKRYPNRKYGLALKAWEYGLNKPYKDYPGSRNVEYDAREFQAFKTISDGQIAS